MTDAAIDEDAETRYRDALWSPEGADANREGVVTEGCPEGIPGWADSKRWSLYTAVRDQLPADCLAHQLPGFLEDPLGCVALWNEIRAKVESGSTDLPHPLPDVERALHDEPPRGVAHRWGTDVAEQLLSIPAELLDEKSRRNLMNRFSA